MDKNPLLIPSVVITLYGGFPFDGKPLEEEVCKACVVEVIGDKQFLKNFLSFLQNVYPDVANSMESIPNSINRNLYSNTPFN